MKITDRAIFADFNNFDPEGFIRLDCSGTVRDLKLAGLLLHVGARLLVSDGDLRAEIEVVSPSSEGIWRGKVYSSVEERNNETGIWSPL